jgi:signal transduction histidine kinase
MRGFFSLRGEPDEVREEIRAAQVSAVFRQMPIALAVKALNAIITFIVLQQLIDLARPLAWVCVVALVTSGRWALWLRYRRLHSSVTAVAQWSRLAACGSLLAGMCWGLGGLVLFPITPVLGQIFLTFVIGGMCAGAVVISASHLPSLLAFLLSASLSMAVLFLGQETRTAAALRAMILVFAAALALAGLHLNRFFAETMRLRFELGAANLRLQAEIKERQSTEAALRQAQKLEAVGQLTGGISHDFNNLLTVVIGNLVLAIEKADNIPAILSLLKSARQAAERGAALIERLLAFARKQRLDPRLVDLTRLIGGIEDLLRRILGDRIRIVITAEADVAPGRVDANQLELAILNLTINARDAMPDGGNLRICFRIALRITIGQPTHPLGNMSSYRSTIPGPAWTKPRSCRRSNRSSPRRKSAVVPASGCRWSKVLPLNPEAMCGYRAKLVRGPPSSSGCRELTSRRPNRHSRKVTLERSEKQKLPLRAKRRRQRNHIPATDQQITRGEGARTLVGFR